ncbi:unnamed protein product [Cuscuta europaea]|uniref:HMA domain-containing protein n=2 Tax=Cuscuta europaea TaxID=41803 RepID=A0A9P1EF92_CUSEU|nr:unnamed protein product [Cuscuta europaea]
MASTEQPPPPEEQSPPPSPLPYKTWVLKVPIHCQACKKKVKKILQSVDGVYIIDIDEKQHKVMVTGNVEAEALIKKLLKSGKNAEIWPPPEKEKKSKGKKDKKNSDDDDYEDEDEDYDEEEEDQKPPVAAESMMKQSTLKPVVKFDVLPPPGNAQAAGEGADKGAKKKKKKKKKKRAQNTAAAGPGCVGAPANAGNEPSMVGMGPHYVGLDQGNMGRPYPNQYPPSYLYAPQQGYVVNYSAAAAAHPAGGTGGPAYYYPPPPAPAPYTPAEVHAMRCRPLDSFEILSDENPNACYVM